MSAAAITVAMLGILTYALKAAGPLVLGGRALPPLVERVAGLMPGPLLGALVMTSTVVAAGPAFVLDARLAGLVAAVVALRMRAGFVVVVLVAAAVTALVRAL